MADANVELRVAGNGPAPLPPAEEEGRGEDVGDLAGTEAGPGDRGGGAAAAALPAPGDTSPEPSGGGGSSVEPMTSCSTPAEEAVMQEARGLIARARVLHGWTGRARALGPEFRGEVLHRVVADYLGQFRAVLAEGAPVLAEVRRLRRSLDQEAQRVRHAIDESETTVDELRLRHLIGELGREEYEARREGLEREVEGLRVALGGVAARGTRLDEVLLAAGQVQNDLDQLLRESADVAEGWDPGEEREVAPPPSAPETPRGGVVGLAARAGVESGDLDEDVPIEEASGDEDSFGDAPPVGAATLPEIAIGVRDGGEVLRASAVEGEPPPVHSSAEWQAALAREPLQPSTSGPASRARLHVTQAGGAEETVWFEGDVISVGRGRNNDVQIRHDAKASRYHCRLVRRGEEFWIEDNRSRNGTLVDGVPAPRRRLLGGERIGVGDTVIRFEIVAD